MCVGGGEGGGDKVICWNTGSTSFLPVDIAPYKKGYPHIFLISPQIKKKKKTTTTYVMGTHWTDLDFTTLSRIFHLYRADRLSKVGENRRTLGKNHLTIREQNLAFPHVARARLEQQW